MINYRYSIVKNLKVIYFISGYLSKIIRILFYKKKYYQKKINEKIAVCGRGYSVNKFFKEDFNSFSKIYIANYSGNDLNYRDYLKLRNKEVSLVSNIEEPIPNIFLILLVNLKESIIARPSYFLKRETYRLNSLGLRVRGIKNGFSMEEYPCNIGNTGLLAIYEASEFAENYNIEEITLYGFDLYSENKNKSRTLREDFLTYEEYINHRKVNIKLSKQMDFLIGQYPNIHFVNNTLNKFKFKSKNINCIQYKN